MHSGLIKNNGFESLRFIFLCSVRFMNSARMWSYFVIRLCKWRGMFFKCIRICKTWKLRTENYQRNRREVFDNRCVLILKYTYEGLGYVRCIVSEQTTFYNRVFYISFNNILLQKSDMQVLSIWHNTYPTHSFYEWILCRISAIVIFSCDPGVLE